jgi:subtilisin family serine protease
VKNTGAVSSFSSRGPTGDGRFKPELVAFGDSPVLIRSNGVVGSSNGTSFSAPQIAALAAGLWEARPEWTKDQLILNLLRSATQYENPDNQLGYGVPNFRDAYYGEILSVDSEESIDWKVYPNPLFGEEINIYFGTGLSSNFQLMDVMGKTLIESELTRADSKLPYRVQMAGIKPGLYIIQMKSGSTIRQSKLLKQ